MNNEEHKKLIDTIHTLEENTQKLGSKFGSYRDTAFSKFPLLFVLLSSFGLVSTFYGFEKLIDSVPILSENPIVLLLNGLLVLVITGSLYKKLS